MNKEQIRKFRRGCAMLIDAPRGYEWGSENLNGADCSGIVCHGLFAAGFRIRITADEIFNKLGNEISYNFMIREFDEGIYCAAVKGFQTVYDRSDKMMGKGKIIHIAPFITPYVVIDANSTIDRILPVAYPDWQAYYSSWRRRIKIIQLNEQSIIEHNGKLFYGADNALIEAGIIYDRL